MPMSIFYELNIGWKSKQIVISVGIANFNRRVGVENRNGQKPLFTKRFAKWMKKNTQTSTHTYIHMCYENK